VDKAPDAFRTISEVAEDLDVPQHVLRFWETRFSQIKPMKRSGGRRYYRPDDVDLLRGIRQLLYGEGYTIRGVQRILREQGIKTVQNVTLGGTVLPVEAADTDEELQEAETDEQDIDDVEVEDEEEAEETPEPVMRSASPTAPSNGTRLSRDDIRKLEAALHELAECRRLLDDATKNARERG
jgi:DNA-binding transcriptional MerR regulator